MGHDLRTLRGDQVVCLGGLCREEGEMNLDSVEDEFAGAGPLH